MQKKNIWLWVLVFSWVCSSSICFAKRKPWLGVQLGKDAKGVMLNGVFVGSAAEKAGMQPGDIVTHIDGKRVTSRAQFTQSVGAKGVGQTVKFDWIRSGKNQSASVPLKPKPNESEMLHEMHMGKKLKNYQLRILEYSKIASSTKKGFFSWFRKETNTGKTAKIVATDTTLEKFSGKPVIIKFWATWCPACLSTHGKLNTFAEQATNVPVLAITTEPEEKVRAFMQKNKPKFKIVVDKGEVIRKDWPFSSIPVFVVADKGHRVQMIEKGAGSVVNRAIATARK